MEYGFLTGTTAPNCTSHSYTAALSLLFLHPVSDTIMAVSTGSESPCPWLSTGFSVREATPPSFCGVFGSRQAECINAYIRRRDEGRFTSVFQRCSYDPTTGACSVGAERFICPVPPAPPLPPPSEPAPEVPPPLIDSWVHHAGSNCYENRGAVDLGLLGYMQSLDECRAACLDVAGCTAITIATEGSYRA